MPASDAVPFAQDNTTQDPLFCNRCGAMLFVLPETATDQCWRCRTQLISSEHPREGNQTKDHIHD